jgi:Cu/Ag efflux protein CusF
MKHARLMIALGLAALTAACGKKAETPVATETNLAAPAPTRALSGDTGIMAMAAGAKMAKGTGKVTALDKAAGTITLDHGPIAEVNWPAMTMAFKATPGLIDSVKVGDEVNFELRLDGNGGEITTIRKK